MGSSHPDSKELPVPVPQAWARARSLTVPLVLLLVLRVPSLFEPHWYTDESGYATTAWMMSHGKVLFLTVWNNKPPLLFWIYQLSLGLFGPSEFGLHLLSTIAEGAALIATWKLARAYLSPARVWVAMLLTALFLATPVFNGDLALPENFLVGCTAWAMVALLASARAPSRPRSLLLAGAAGILFAGACLIQQTALADLAAGAVVLVLVGRRGWTLAVTTILVSAVAVAVTIAPFVWSAGLHNVLFFLVSSYAGYTGTSLQLSFWTLMPRLLAGILLVWGVYSARHWPAARLLPWVWLAALLLAYVLPNRPYVHFLLPAVPAAALLLARLRRPHWRHWGGWAGLSLAPLLGSVLVVTAIWVTMLAAGFSSGTLFTVKLTAEYFPAFVGKLTGSLSASTYVQIYDQRASAVDDAVQWVKKNHLSGSTAVVWSPDAWAYLLGRLQPVLPGPTIYTDHLWLGQQELLKRVQQERPVVVILTSDSYTQFGPILPLLQRGYTEVEASAQGELWVRSDVASRVLTAAPARVAASRSGN